MAGTMTQEPYSLVKSTPYQEALTLQPEQDPYQSDVLKQTLSQGETAGMRAKKSALDRLSQQGFGGSTFGEQLGSIAESKAKQPYIESAINASNQIKQQRIQNLMNMLTAGQSGLNQQQQYGMQEKQFGLSQNQLALQQRQTDINEMIQKGQLSVQQGQLELAKLKQQQDYEAAKRKQETDWFTSLVGGVLPVLGNVFGGPIGGLVANSLAPKVAPGQGN